MQAQNTLTTERTDGVGGGGGLQFNLISERYLALFGIADLDKRKGNNKISRDFTNIHQAYVICKYEYKHIYEIAPTKFFCSFSIFYV